MAMRMTGMMSGMDTESIIQELVAARRKKVDVKKKEQTRIDWKQEIWKELNTKLKRLQSKYIANMRFSDAYSKKTTKVSNSNAVSIITGENAMNGVQTMTVDQLAKSGYLTGGKIEGSGVTALTKLSEIDPAYAGGGVFTVKNGEKSVDIKVDQDTTISDVLNQIKEVGLNANFDAKQQRFYITAADSGAAGDFSFTASNEKGADAMKLLGLQTKIGSGEGEDNKSYAEYSLYAKYYSKDADAVETINQMIQKDIVSRTQAYLNEYNSLQSSIDAAQKSIDDINKKYADAGETLKSVSDYENDLVTVTQEIDDYKKTHSESDPGYAEGLQALHEKSEAIKAKKADAQTLVDQQKNITDYKARQVEISGTNGYITIESDGTAAATAKLKNEIQNRYDDKAQYAASVVDPATGNVLVQGTGTATKVSGQDAKITLNGAEYTSNSNTFDINGLTITALDTTKAGEVITVTTQQDTDGIYDMVKNFLKEYNAIVNEMDKLYNADRAKGYEPLTDEEKEAMSEKDIEKWESKVKDSLLRRDDNLSTVNSALQSIMSSGFNVNGKTMYLYDFGIETLGYFESPDNEKHAYHIAGDPDDEYTMNSADKLKSMISNDPDAVISFFSQLSRGLYDKMTDMSKSVEGYRSFGNFYDDKKMKSDYDSYTKKIAEMETKLNEYEDKWYKKFSKMETALAKMQSNMSAVSSLLGG